MTSTIIITEQGSIPTIDFSLITKGSLDEQSKIISELCKACEEWGVFRVINHGITNDLVERVFNAADEFFSTQTGRQGRFQAKT